MSWMTGKEQVKKDADNDHNKGEEGERRASFAATMEGAASWFIKTVETYMEEATTGKER